MVTKNFKSLLAAVLTANDVGVGVIPIRDITGVRRYANSIPNFPYSREVNYTLNPAARGISIGSGGTAATEEDYQLEDTITTDVDIKVNVREFSHEYGCPTLSFTITITNIGHEDVIVREVGYKQNINAAITPGRASSGAYTCLLDRTVLDQELVISPGLAGVLVYKLKTIPRKEKTVNGIKIVDFAFGTDEEIGAIIDAAQAGTIDLQRDAGWRVGDMRKITIQSFISNLDTSTEQPYQDIDIAISSFEEYEGCGNVMQFDFMQSLWSPQRAHNVNNYVGGYGASEIRTVALPALVEALPEWLKSRLKTFDVTVVDDTNAALETVSGNKLALRSEAEVLGRLKNASILEGEQVELYKYKYYPKGIGNEYRTNAGDGWWLRSHSTAYGGCYIHCGGNFDTGVYLNSSGRGIAPFGCL